jgi:hypothetical protein
MVTHHRFAEIGGRRVFYREADSAAAPAVVCCTARRQARTSTAT